MSIDFAFGLTALTFLEMIAMAAALSFRNGDVDDRFELGDLEL